MTLKQDLDYDEAIEKLKEAILEQSRISGKLINPLSSGSKHVFNIMCTWIQMFKSMEMAEKEWNRTHPIYWLNGKSYRKLSRNEVIMEGALHSYDNGELMPILAQDTVGDTPNSFNDKREFYNPIDAPVVKKEKSMGDYLREHIDG